MLNFQTKSQLNTTSVENNDNFLKLTFGKQKPKQSIQNYNSQVPLHLF